MSKVLVIGGAGQGRQVIDAIVARGHHEVVGVLDRSFRRGDVVAGYPVLGTDDDLRAAALETAADSFVVAIGDNFTRGRILERETGAAAHLHPATVVHPAATGDDLHGQADEDVYEPLRSLGGSVSAEHGIGREKRAHLAISRSPEEIELMRLLKRTLDPNGILNPDKVL